MLRKVTSSIDAPGTPLIMEEYRLSAFHTLMSLIRIRFMVPMGVPSGLRIRAPRRRKIGALTIFLMVILLITMSSRWPPSTVSSASPRQCSKIQLVRTMLRKPPLLSVPSLMRPVRYPWSGACGSSSCQLPSSTLPLSNPLT